MARVTRPSLRLQHGVSRYISSPATVYTCINEGALSSQNQITEILKALATLNNLITTGKEEDRLTRTDFPHFNKRVAN